MSSNILITANIKNIITYYNYRLLYNDYTEAVAAAGRFLFEIEDTCLNNFIYRWTMGGIVYGKKVLDFIKRCTQLHSVSYE